uniref:Tetraspanin n=1 Tax=Timema bartmani TaxID=61472 RepID=A0A7R9EZX1_9NEOP|nr:unnamed protein product [Timema bartmani]
MQSYIFSEISVGECCGLESSEDWVEAQIEVPDSCCHKDIEDCDTSNKKHIYKDGCLQFMFDTVDTIINIIIIVTVVVLSIQFTEKDVPDPQPYASFTGLLEPGLKLLMDSSHFNLEAVDLVYTLSVHESYYCMSLRN